MLLTLNHFSVPNYQQFICQIFKFLQYFETVKVLPSAYMAAFSRRLGIVVDGVKRKLNSTRIPKYCKLLKWKTYQGKFFCCKLRHSFATLTSRLLSLSCMQYTAINKLGELSQFRKK